MLGEVTRQESEAERQGDQLCGQCVREVVLSLEEGAAFCRQVVRQGVDPETCQGQIVR